MTTMCLTPRAGRGGCVARVGLVSSPVPMWVAALLVLGARAGAAPAALGLHLSVAQTVLQTHQPLRVLVRAANEGDGDVAVAFTLLSRGPRGGMVVKGPQGESVVTFALMSGPPDRERTSPGLAIPVARPRGYEEHLEAWLDYDYRKREHVFAVPGEYVVQASLFAMIEGDDRKAKPLALRSEEVRVRVIEPTEWPDRVAQGMWVYPLQSTFLLGGGSVLQSLIDDSSITATDYGAYLAYARSRDGQLPLSVRIAVLKTITGHPPPQLLDLVLLDLARLSDEANDPASALVYARRAADVATAPPWRKDEAAAIIKRLAAKGSG